MARPYTQTQQPARIQQRIDRMVADTLRRLITVALSVSGFMVILCCLNSLR